MRAPDAKEQALLDFIAQKEGLGDDMARRYHFASGYDIPFGYGRYGSPPKPLTQMTLGDIDAYQTALAHSPQNGGHSTPVGKYQITQATLRGLKRDLQLNDGDVFTPELQDRLGREMLRQKGLDKYRTGQITAQDFQNRVAQKWDSIPKSGTGHSSSGQARATTDEQVQTAIGPLAPIGR